MRVGCSAVELTTKSKAPTKLLLYGIFSCDCWGGIGYFLFATFCVWDGISQTRPLWQMSSQPLPTFIRWQCYRNVKMSWHHQMGHVCRCIVGHGIHETELGRNVTGEVFEGW